MAMNLQWLLYRLVRWRQKVNDELLLKRGKHFLIRKIACVP